MRNLKKKDFVAIAEIINKNTTFDFDILRDSFIYDLCEWLKTTNGQFKEKEFKALCGVEE
jgi:hypothetical protein